MRKKWIFIVPAAIAGMVLFAFIGGEIVMRLWNWLLPPLFGWQQITFWQAFALLALCRILFGGFGHRGWGRSNMRPRLIDRVADRFADRVNAMSPEEKERFRQRMRERCGWGPVSAVRAPDSASEERG